MIYEFGPAYKRKIAIVSFRQNMVGERVASVLSRRQGICPGVELLPDILAGPDRPSGASGRHDSLALESWCAKIGGIHKIGQMLFWSTALWGGGFAYLIDKKQ